MLPPFETREESSHSLLTLEMRDAGLQSKVSEFTSIALDFLDFSNATAWRHSCGAAFSLAAMRVSGL